MLTTSVSRIGKSLWAIVALTIFTTTAAFADTATPMTISGLSPNTCVAGAPGFTLTVNGSGFGTASTVVFGTTKLSTTISSSTKLTAVVPGSSVANAGNITVGVTNGEGKGYSNTVTFSVTAATVTTAPTISSLSPTGCAAGSSDFTLTVGGTNFINGSTVYFGERLLTTTYVSSTKLTALVPAVAVATAGKVGVVVTNGEGKGHSSAASFSVTTTTTTTPPPAPTISGLSPNSVVAGSGDFTLTVTGTNFISTSVVVFGTKTLATTFGSSTQLTAAVPGSAVATAGDFGVTVTNGEGKGHSESEDFTVTQPANTSPTIASMSPTGCVAGSAGFTLTITGTNFIGTSTIYFGGKLLTTTVVSDTKLTAPVSADAVAKAGKLAVAVTNGEGKGHSSVVYFVVSERTVTAPSISTIAPANCVVGSADLTLTVNGANFDGASVVNFGTKALTTTFVSSTQLSASIPGSSLATAGAVQVSVTDGSTKSKSVSFVIKSATVARVMYAPGTPGAIGNDTVGVLFTFCAPTAPDFTQPVSLTLGNPGTVNTAEAQVLKVSNLILTPSTQTLDGGQVAVYVYNGNGLLLMVTPLAHNQYCLVADATGLDLSAVDMTRLVSITVTIGTQTFHARVTPYTLNR